MPNLRCPRPHNPAWIIRRRSCNPQKMRTLAVTETNYEIPAPSVLIWGEDPNQNSADIADPNYNPEAGGPTATGNR